MSPRTANGERARGCLLRALATGLLLAGSGFAACRLSPWPGSLLVRWAFDAGGRRAAQALERHVPAGVGERLDLRYGSGADERLDLFRAPGGAARPLMLVWIHGGAWVAGCKEDVANYGRILASHGYAVASIEYARAPGSHYPTPVRQVFQALGWLLAHANELALDTRRLVIAGDSAGAQIAAQVANIVRVPDYAALVGVLPSIERAQVAGVVLFCGAYDVALVDLDGPAGGFLRTVLWAYSGRKDFELDARFESAWVLRHLTSAFPPAFVSAGNGDPLAPQSHALVAGLERQGVRVESLFFPADHAPPLAHEYQFDLDTAAGRQALECLLAFLADLEGGD
jgi:acetyl esterase/lipase